MPTLEAIVLSRAPAAIVVLDAFERVAYLNGASERLYGWSREEAIGRRASSLGLHPPEADLPAGFLDALGGGGSWEGELAFRRRDGSCASASTGVAPLYDAGGHYVGLISVALPVRPGRLGARPREDDARARRIGRRIAEARREAGLTQRELAAAVGVTRRSLQGYEAGRIVPYRHLDILGRVLRRDAHWFLVDPPQSAAEAKAGEGDFRLRFAEVDRNRGA